MHVKKEEEKKKLSKKASNRLWHGVCMITQKDTSVAFTDTFFYIHDIPCISNGDP